MRTSLRTLLGAVAVAALLPAISMAAEDERYGYVRTLEGTATITSEGGDRQEAQINEPLLDGDLVEVASRSRIDLELADRNRPLHPQRRRERRAHVQSHVVTAPGSALALGPRRPAEQPRPRQIPQSEIVSKPDAAVHEIEQLLPLRRVG